MARRKITMEQDLEMPVVPHLPAIAVTESERSGDPAVPELVGDDLLDLIIQPEEVPDHHSAMDNYLDEVPAAENQTSDAATLQRRMFAPSLEPQSTLQVEWQHGTSGQPRAGSRSLRLCRGGPAGVAERMPQIPPELLRVESTTRFERAADDSIEWDGLLFIKRGRHEIPVALTLRWFNPRFTLAEVRITGRQHVPRRFFAVAHSALGFLET